MKKFSEIFDMTKIKIIETLVDMNNFEDNISDIVKISKMNHVTIKKKIDELEDDGLVSKKEFGRIKIYRLKDENVIMSCLINLIEDVNKK